MKRLGKWVPHELTANQKNHHFEVSSFLILCNNNQPFLNWDCDLQWKVNCIQQPAMTSSVVGLRRSSKALTKAKLAPKKGHGHCLVACCWSDPLQLSESWWNHYIWEVCSANQWNHQKLQPVSVNRKGPVLLHDNTWPKVAQPKVEGIGLRCFASSAIFTWPWPMDYYFFNHLDNFLQEKFHNQQDTENAFQEFVEFWSIDFYATGVSKLLSSWQKCVDCKGSCFD